MIKKNCITTFKDLRYNIYDDNLPHRQNALTVTDS